MNRPSRAVLVLSAVLILAACAPSVAPTSTPGLPVADTPTLPPSPTPSATPVSPRTLEPCPVGYTRYGGSDIAFSACYPEGWVVSAKRDAENEFTQVTFSPPAGAEGAGLRFVSVSVQPAFENYTDEDFFQEIDNWLLLEYYDRLLVSPQLTEVDGRRAVHAAYEARIVLQRRVVDLTRWITALRANDLRWFIEVAGRTENRDELERMRAHFLASFHIEEP
jgi:hypothetical protein